MRKLGGVGAAASLGIGVILGAAGVSIAGTDEAPLPLCAIRPETANQGKETVLRGQRWARSSSVTVEFDGVPLSSVVTTDDTVEPGDDDRAPVTDPATVAVNKRGRFRTDVLIPQSAWRGTHSINVLGFDSDGEKATCAVTQRVTKQPVTTTTTTATNDDETSTTTGTTEDSNPSDGASTTTSSTSP